MYIDRYGISIQPFRIPSHSMSWVLVATPNDGSSPSNSPVFSILARNGELLLTAKPSFVVREELGIDVVENGIKSIVVVVGDVK